MPEITNIMKVRYPLLSLAALLFWAAPTKKNTGSNASHNWVAKQSHTMINNGYDSIKKGLTTFKIALFIGMTCLVGSSIFPSTGLAKPTGHAKQTQQVSLKQQRAAYKKAQKAIKNKDYTKAKGYLRTLKDYPLKPYIEYELLAHKLKNYKALAATNRNRASLRHPLQKSIDVFLAQYPDSILADRLTGRWLSHLAKGQHWEQFKRYYSSGFKSAPMQCWHTEARFHTRLDTTEGKAILEEGLALWTVGKSQPKACDPLFKLIKQHNLLSAEAIWQRFKLAMIKGNVSLAKYLQKQLPQPKQRLAKQFISVRSTPSQITDTARFIGTTTEVKDIVSYGVKRFARQNPQKAWEAWETYSVQMPFSATDNTDVKQYILRYLIRKDELGLAQNELHSEPLLRSNKLAESLLRKNLRALNWQAVIKNIALLDTKKQRSDRWRYWQARANAVLGTANTDPRVTFESLAQERSWYGFLAADIMNMPYRFNEDTSQAGENFKKAVTAHGSAARAKELWHMAQLNQARKEWHSTLKKLSGEELLAAGELAYDWGWANGSIVAMIKAKRWDHMQLRFPIAHRQAIQQAAERHASLDETFIYAIARQESAFAVDVVSSAGARGLMQLMPATAKDQAKRSGIRHTTSDLFQAEHNIKLGSAYLNGLIDDFKGNRILAAASYNAGKSRIKRWRPDSQSALPADVWIEVIPFKETRGYVQNVLAYDVIYRHILQRARSIKENANELETKRYQLLKPIEKIITGQS